MSEHITHDRLFKELIENFFEEFMMLFFPEANESIDFATIRFLPQELFTDVTEGDKHVVDLLVETKLKGEDGLINIHVENQASSESNFNERMFIYFSRIFQKYRRKILPIAIFSYDTPRKNEPDKLEMNFSFAKVLHFKYQIVELKKQNWRDYIRYPNPVAAALLSKMGYNNMEKVEVKKEFFRILINLELDMARKTLITGFFETYLQLNEKEEFEFEEEVKTMEPKEREQVMEIITSYEQRGREVGREEGRQEGRQEGRREGIKEVAKRMLAKGKSIEEVIELTGLTREKVKALKEVSTEE